MLVCLAGWWLSGSSLEITASVIGHERDSQSGSKVYENGLKRDQLSLDWGFALLLLSLV